MDPVEALHTAARLYGGTVRPVDQDLPDANDRNAIAVLIGDVVELYTPESFASLDQARETLAELATTFIPDLIASTPVVHEGLLDDDSAAGPFWKWGLAGVWRDDWSRTTLNEVLTGFADYVREVSVDELSGIEPLPYRRTLTEDQAAEVFEGLRVQWGMSDLDWYPLDRLETDDPPPNTVAFDAEPFADEEHQELLRRVLDEIGVERVLHLFEHPEPDREVALEWFEPGYAASENVATDRSYSWLVHASHESSVTVSGQRLLPALKAAWPEWERFTSWSEYW